MAVTFALAGFGPALEASFGLNFAFGLLEQIHDGGARSYNDKKKRFFDEQKEKLRNAKEGGSVQDAEIRRTEEEWDESERQKVKTSERIVRCAVRWAYLTTFVSFGLLAWIGFSPAMQISLGWTSVVLIVFALPTPAVYFYLKHFWKKAHAQLTLQLDTETRVIQRVALIKKELMLSQRNS